VAEVGPGSADSTPALDTDDDDDAPRASAVALHMHMLRNSSNDRILLTARED
jgi:hypothetical protein